MHAEIIAIGDEITSGQLLDTNSQWLSLRLEEMGVRVLYHSTVGDELAPCADVFRRAVDRADLVVATGGLGPTADDLTRDALALATDRELLQDAAALEQIRALFARRQRPMPAQNERQALFPAGSRVIVNPHGTAPGIDLEVPRPGRKACRVFVMPGVPAEMYELWAATVAPAVRTMVGQRRVIRRCKIHCFGAGESQVESMLPDLIRRGRQPTVGITASQSTITLRIVAEGDSEAECAAAMAPTIATIQQCLGALIFGAEDDDLQRVVVRRLHETRQTLATVECATAGIVAEWLSRVENAADVYLGGLAAMTPAACAKPLALAADAIRCEAANSVAALAIACRERFGVDLGLAVGPFPAAGEAATSAGAPPQVVIALADAQGVQTWPVAVNLHPALRQIYCAKHALNYTRLALAAKST